MTPGCACQSNLQQLWRAFQAYQNDWESRIPSSYLYGRSQSWNPDDFVRFASEQGTLPSPGGARGQSWPMVLYPYFRDQESLWCPSDHGRDGSPTARISYYWKAAVDRAWYGDPYVVRFTGDWNFAHPGDQVLLYERNEQPAEPLPVSGVGEPAWYNYPFGEASPAFGKGRNWDPTIWGDSLP